jgi:hypothetical protein
MPGGIIEAAQLLGDDPAQHHDLGQVAGQVTPCVEPGDRFRIPAGPPIRVGKSNVDVSQPPIPVIARRQPTEEYRRVFELPLAVRIAGAVSLNLRRRIRDVRGQYGPRKTGEQPLGLVRVTGRFVQLTARLPVPGELKPPAGPYRQPPALDRHRYRPAKDSLWFSWHPSNAATQPYAWAAPPNTLSRPLTPTTSTAILIRW